MKLLQIYEARDGKSWFMAGIRKRVSGCVVKWTVPEWLKDLLWILVYIIVLLIAVLIIAPAVWCYLLILKGWRHYQGRK